MIVKNALLLSALIAVPAGAATVDYSTNLALAGSAVVGVAATADGNFAYTQNGDPASRINDGNLGTRVQTHVPNYLSNAPTTNLYDYAGVTWAAAQNDVAAVRIHHATFGDGGWYATPAANDSAAADSLSFAPTVQYSTDGGVTWTAVSGQSDDYATTVTPNVPPGSNATLVGPATFTFDAVDGITGLRLVGDGWGPSGNDASGFIGVYEFEAFANVIPEPASLTLLGAAGLLIRRRR